MNTKNIGFAADPNANAFSTVPKNEYNAGYNIMCHDPSFNKRLSDFAAATTAVNPYPPPLIPNISYQQQYHGYNDHNISTNLIGANNMGSQAAASSSSMSCQMKNWNMSENTTVQQQANVNYIYPANYSQHIAIDERYSLQLPPLSMCQTNNLDSTATAGNCNLPYNLQCQQGKQESVEPEDIDNMTDSFSNIL